MGNVTKKLFGGGDTGMIEKAQRQQAAAIAEEKAKADAVEAGQRRARSGGRGLLAFVDDQLPSSLGGGQ